MSNSLWLHGLLPTTLFSAWDLPDKNTGVGCHFLWGDLLTQESNPHLLCFLHWQADLLPLRANNPLHYPNEHCFWHWVFNTTVLHRKSGAQCQLQPLHTCPCRLPARHFHALQTVYKLAPEKLKGEAFTLYTFKADLKQRASFVLTALDLGLGWRWAQPPVQFH